METNLNPRVVSIKPASLNPGESVNDLFVVVEDNGNRLVIAPINMGGRIGDIVPLETVPADSVVDVSCAS